MRRHFGIEDAKEGDSGNVAGKFTHGYNRCAADQFMDVSKLFLSGLTKKKEGGFPLPL
jgi:hypothetical protein